MSKRRVIEHRQREKITREGRAKECSKSSWDVRMSSSREGLS